MYGLRRHWRQRPGIALPFASEYNKKERRAPSASPLVELPPSRRGGRPSTETAPAGRPPGLARPRAARRSPLRSAGALAAAALLALSGALALPATAEAQTETTLVSNIGTATILRIASADYSQQFTTGSHAAGYTLTGVDIPVAATSTALTAQVCETNINGHPTSTCTELMAPSSVAGGTASFTAPSNTQLASATTYAVTLSLTGQFGYTFEDNEDAGGAAGWSIENAYESYNTVTDAWVSNTGSRAVRIAIKGSEAADSPTACTLNPGDLWCGVVTVALHSVDGFDFAYGFVDASATTNTSDTGALSAETFSVGSNNYTIDNVTVGIEPNSGQLNFSLTSDLTAADKEKLVVHVGSRAFAFDDVDPNSSSGYRWAMSGLDWTSETSVTLRLRANTAPVFADASATREVEENSAVGTSVGAVVTATDADSDTLTYSLEGTDAASFAIDSGTGQIMTVTGVTYDFEATQNSYSVTVKADDGNDGTDTIEVNIALLDADEKSDKPDKPELAKVTGSTTSLTATWEKPGLNGGPDITGYKLEYKLSTETSWTAFAHTGTAVTTTITGLTADTSYQARVRAENGETDSDWSDASDAVSTNAETVTPTCTLNPRRHLVRRGDGGAVQYSAAPAIWIRCGQGWPVRPGLHVRIEQLHDRCCRE